MSPRVMPAQRPGQSEQAVGTPPEFLSAVEGRFGSIVFDLAANCQNSVAGTRFYGPGSSYGDDSFASPWDSIGPGLRWLNPQYGEIGRWAQKCAMEREYVALLVPASVGTNWYADHVHGQALVLFLRPRLTFVGHTQPYPKDLMLAVYGEAPGVECWRWRS